MSFILSHNEVDDSRSTWAEPELEVLPTPPGRKRRASRELQEDMKVELYKSCIEALKPSNNVEKGDKNNCLLTEEETFGKTVADTLARFAAPQKAIAKKRISDVLFELEMGAFNDNFSSSNSLNTQQGIQFQYVGAQNYSQFQPK